MAESVHQGASFLLFKHLLEHVLILARVGQMILVIWWLDCSELLRLPQDLTVLIKSSIIVLIVL